MQTQTLLPGLRAMLVSSVAALSMLSGAVLGQGFTSTLLLSRVESAVDRPLPSVGEVFGSEPGRSPAPIVAIGYLSNSDPHDPSDWGGAVGWYVMEAANGAYSEFAIVPSYQYRSDGRGEAEDAGTNRRDQLARVAARTGARLGITGTIGVRDGRFDLSLELLEYPSDRRVASRQKSGELSALSATIPTLTQELLAEAVAAVYPAGTQTAGTIAAPAPGEFEALASGFAKAKRLSADEGFGVVEALRREHPNFASVATLYLAALEASGSAAQVRAKVPTLLVNGARTLTSETYGYLLESQNAEIGIDPEAVSKLTQLVLANPTSFATWLALSNAYIGENVLYREQKGCRTCPQPVDHHLGYAKAIVLASEVVRRWPDHYRGWWALSYSLWWYASLVRGTAHWRDVPEEQRRRFQDLMAVADDCLAEAIRRHPYQAALYVNRLPFDVENGRDRMSTFRRAAELDPHSRRLYQIAFNYARPQWGGSLDDLREIYDVAKQNNPDADWPREVRNASAPEIKPFIDWDAPWIRRGLAIFVLLLLVAGLWQFWRQRRG